jgi:hypothetical protein
VNRKYPLETLRQARADEVDKRKRAHGEAARREQAARDDLDRQKTAQEALVERVRKQEKDEHERLLRGELFAADLARGAAFGVRTDIEKKVSARNVDQARARHEGERAEAHAKQSALARASADSKVVEKSRDAWKREQEKAAERAEETEAEEVHAARAHRKGRS